MYGHESDVEGHMQSRQNGVTGFVALAMCIVSIVPNTAAMEHLFSKFGIIHMKLCNHLHPDKVRKQVIVRADTMSKFPMPSSNKHKFGCNEGNTDNEGVDELLEAPTAITMENNDNATSALQTQPWSVFEDQPFAEIASELVAEAATEDEINPLVNFMPGQPTTNHPGDRTNLELKNLFNFPATGAMHSPALATLMKFWAAGQTGLLCEAEYHDLIYEQSNSTFENYY
jgi:hypothetical protein